MKKVNKKYLGFTLIELLVTITIIAILSAVAVYGLNAMRYKSQDTTKLSGLRELEISVEAYKSVNGVYPDAGDQSSTNYIINLSPTFIKKLPIDAQSQSGTTGFHYAVSTDKKTFCVSVRGTVYKPESQTDINDSVHTKSWQSCNGPEAATLGPAN